MPINVIDKKMIVQNKIELHPSISYISASSDCNFLDRLEVEQAGTYGFVNSSNTNIKVYKDYTDDTKKITRHRLYNVSDNFISDSSTDLLTKIENFKDDLVELETDLISKGISETNRNNAFITEFSASQGIQFNTTGKHQFEVERIKKEFIIDSQSYKKKSSVFNLYEFYRENIKYNNFHDLHWGFKNYNSLNFFNINEDININFLNNVTHKNCLIYPNLLNDNKQIYDFTNTSDFAISFYINPKRKNKQGFHYNPGCIINIPGVVSVYIVKGNSLDQNGLSDKFRILTEFGEKTYTSLSITSNNFNFSNPSKQNVGLNYLSSDNILSYNNWHNVCLTYRKNVIASSIVYYFSLYIDGVLIDSINHSGEILTQNTNSFITIGNKVLVEKEKVNDFVLKSFSKDLNNLGDNIGPYVKKHILFGNQIVSVLNSASDAINTYTFENVLNTDNSSYIDQNTSCALNAELYDIRIYNQSLEIEKINTICKNGINNIEDEKSNFGLTFYVPVYFKSQNVRKQGLVNLSAPYKKIVNNDVQEQVSIEVDDLLEGKYLLNGVDQNIDESDFKIKTENISYNSSINPYFFTFTGGTDMSVEHFTREFVQETQPNIVIGGNISEDTYQNCFLSKSSFILNDLVFNDKIKKGVTPDSFIKNIYETSSLDSLNTINSLRLNANIDHQIDSIIFRNYMILPNDNGIQKQYYNNNVFKYNLEDDYLDIHKDDLNEVDFSFVSLNNINKDFSLNTEISSRLLTIPEYYIRNELTPFEERREFFITNDNITFISNSKKIFNEFSDKLRNISLNNYHSQFKISFIDSQNESSTNSWRKPDNSISLSLDLSGRGDFYKTFSNPAQRSYYSSHDNSISLVDTFDQKQIAENTSIVYKKVYPPLWQLENNLNENCSSIFCISNQIFNKKIKKETFSIKDVDLLLTSGLSLSFKDSSLGTLYRCDSLTKPAEWNTSGNILYNEGLLALLHPSLYNFGLTNFKIDSKTHASLNVFELNLPAHAGETNLSKNKSYIEDLRIDKSAFNSDEDFVYITDIDIHDENLNVVAKAKLAQPFPKKNSDNVLFRVKMDF